MPNCLVVLWSCGKSTGKYYFEFLVSAIVVGQSNFFIPGVGTIQGLGTYLQYPGQWASSIGHQPAATEYTNGFTAANGTNFSLSVNGVIGIAVDFGAGKVWIAYNNNWDTGAHGSNPATGANAWATFTPGPTLYPVIGLYQNNPGNSVTIVSGSSLTYAAPSGFSNWV